MRLDDTLVHRNLADSLPQAKSWVMTGKVIVNNVKITKCGHPVKPADTIQILSKEKTFVSRSGHKLEGALKEFGIPIRNRSALDIGQSTGGFTECLLRHHAAFVLGIDVGYGLLDYGLRCNPSVGYLEKYNARHLTKVTLQLFVQTPDKLSPVEKETHVNQIDLAVMDVSFISTFSILPVVKTELPQITDYIVMIKPQFEAEKYEVPPGGIIKDEPLRLSIIRRCVEKATRCGLKLRAQTDAALEGTKGNREHFLWLTP